MGFNTVVVVLNDAVGYIAEDPGWGERLTKAICAFSTRKWRKESQTVAAYTPSGRGVFCNTAQVISQAHADGYQIVVAHGNTGWEITSDPEDGVPDSVVKAVEWRLKQRRAALKKKGEAA